MRWALTLTGTHVEGPDRTRVDAIVAEFADRLNSNGYHLTFRDVTVDLGPGKDLPNLEVSNPAVAREAAKLFHEGENPPVLPVSEPPREVLDKWVEEDALEAGPEEVFEAKPVNVAFASDEAGELAVEKGLTTRNFQGIKPSSANGFTVADVKKAAKRAGK